MKKTLKKWSLWACGVFVALCLGGGVGVATLNTLQEASITASAATTYEVGAIKAENSSSATALYITAFEGDGTTWGAEEDWNSVYTFQQGSGKGLTLNGEVLTTTDIKQPGSFFINLGVTATEGDVVILDGTYSNQTTGKTFVFTNSALRYNGSAWETCTAVALGSVTASGDARTLTLSSDETLTSGKNLELVKGGITVNGENANARLQSAVTTASGIILEANMDDAVADVVFICGLFKGSDNTYYAVSDSYFMWEGTQWRTLTGYDAIIDKAVASTTMEQKASGFYIPIKSDTGISDWAATSIVSGHGLKLNGKALAEGVIKFYYDTVYVDLATTAKAGDVLTINGLYQHATGCKVLFAPTQALRYNGSTWEHISYTTYDLDGLVVADSSSQVGSATTKADNLYLARADAGWIPVNSSSVAFTYESGANVKRNGVVIDYTMKSVGGNSLFLEFDSVSAGEIISIGGTFVCESQEARYVIKEGYFKWNGSSWEAGEAYIKTEIDSIEVANNDNNRKGFFINAPHGVGVTSWDNTFTLESGDGFMLNGEAVSGAYIKPIGSQLYVDVQNMPVNSGDVLTVQGTFICEVDGVTAEIVFPQTQALKWNGMLWTVDPNVTYNIGALVLHGNSSVGGASGDNSVLYLQRADGEALPVLSWADADVFTYERGEGFKINDVQTTPSVIKSTGDGFYWAFDGVSKGDVISISGTFVCESQGVRYIIKESYFDWDGSKWNNDVVYTATHTISYLQPTSPSTNAGATNAQVYLKINGSDGLPVQTWDKLFTLRKGDGLTVNGVSKPIYEMKSTGDGLWLRFDAVSAGDVVSLSGTFVCKDLFTKYEIVESTFTYDGSKWAAVLSYNDEDLVAFDTVTGVDLGWGLNKTFIDTTHLDLTGTAYEKSAENTTGSIKFRFNYSSTNTAGDVIAIRLRGTDAWNSDIYVSIIWGGIGYVVDGNVYKAYTFSDNTNYLIEIGAINVKNSADVWTYIKVDGVLVGTKIAASATDTNRVSVYVEAATNATLSDPDHVSVSYDVGSSEFVEKGSEYQLSTENTSESTFIGWLVGNTVYQAGETITIGEESLAFTKLALDFVLKEGAAIRLSNTADDSGIRFTSMINTQQLNALAGYGLTVVYGTLIMPNDYLSAGQAPNLEDFTAGSTVLQIPNTEYREEIGAYTVYYGAMKKLYTTNYHRDFAGRGYMIVTYANGSTKTIYTPFSVKDNVRSVRTVAQKFKEDEAEYSKISDTKKAVVEAYISGVTTSNVNATATVASVQEGYAAAYVYANKQNYLA